MLAITFRQFLPSFQDTFSMAVSFLSGKVVYISPQGSSLLRSKPEKLQGALFSELLAPQDVSTFYSSTAPCRLPSWASCIGSGAWACLCVCPSLRVSVHFSFQSAKLRNRFSKVSASMCMDVQLGNIHQ